MNLFRTNACNNNIIYHYKPLSEYGGHINFNGHSGCTVFLAPHARLEEGTISIRGNNAAVFIGNARLARCTIAVYHDCTFYIGNNGYINGEGDRQVIQIAEQTAVIIGDSCWLSYPLEITTSDAHLIFDLKTRRRLNQAASIFIGDHVWIGRDVRIYKGARISSGSIVATKAFLSSKLYPSHSIIAGVPGRPLSEREVFWDGHNSLIFSEVDSKNYSELSDNDSIVESFIYQYDDKQIITPQDIELNLRQSKHSENKIAFLYETLFVDSKHNRFVWNCESENKEARVMSCGHLFKQEKKRMVQIAEVFPVRAETGSEKNMPYTDVSWGPQDRKLIELCRKAQIAALRREWLRCRLLGVMIAFDFKKSEHYKNKAKRINILLKELNRK